MSAVKQWYSASELAGLPHMPMHSRHVSERVIALAPAHAVQQANRRGGGREVHFSVLPEATRKALIDKYERQMLASQKAASLPALLATRPAAASEEAQLTSRQRDVLTARAVVLSQITSMMLDGMSQNQAIELFLTQFHGARLSPEVLRSLEPLQGKCCRRNIYSWLKYRDQQGALGLAPLKVQKKDQPTWFEHFLDLYQRPQKPSAKHALRQLWQMRGVEEPSYPQVKRALTALTPIERAVGRFGRLALRARLAYKKRDTSDLLPASIYVADGKTFDAEVAHPLTGHPFKPEITSIIDVHTRLCVGWSVSLKENTLGVVDALRKAATDYGIPAIFYTDNGSGYRNKEMDGDVTGFMSRLGISPMRALPYNSQAKGIVERFQQHYVTLAKDSPLYLGADMDPQAAKAAHKASRKDVKEGRISPLLWSFEEFLDRLALLIVTYNKTPHSALPLMPNRSGHYSPLAFWQMRSEGLDPFIPSAEEARDMFRPHEVRCVRRAAVSLWSSSFFAIELERYDGMDVCVSYEVQDGSRVFVRELTEDKAGRKIPGAFICEAIFEGNKTRYVPVSREQLAIENRVKGQKRLLTNKMDRVEAQLRPMLMGEAAPVFAISNDNKELIPQGAEKAEVIQFSPSQKAFEDISVKPALEPIKKPQILAKGERPIFRDDFEFGIWLSSHPDKATNDDRNYLQRLLPNQDFKSLIERRGGSIKTLQSLARFEPFPTPHSDQVH